jgi:hypothetical protein
MYKWGHNGKFVAKYWRWEGRSPQNFQGARVAYSECPPKLCSECPPKTKIFPGHTLLFSVPLFFLMSFFS